MGRKGDVRDDEESYEMENSPKRKYATQWGHWRGPDFEDTRVDRRTPLKQFFDTFKREPNTIITPEVVPGGTGREFDPAGAAYATAHAPLARQLKGRHLQMIAFGGSIGTGLFVASGKSLAEGGPGSLLICFVMVGMMLYCTVHALGELAVVFPIAGSFSAYSTRFIDPAWGFSMGWNYALQWLVVLPLEIISASITINFWDVGQSYPHAIFVTIFLFGIMAINLFGVKGYGEGEFLFSIIKVTAIIGYIILGVIMNLGGDSTSGYIGGRYWHVPGAFHDGFKGLCSVLVNATFSFTGTELLGLAAAETANPRKSLPTAVKQVFWRITLFYIVSLTLVGLLVPYTDPRLLQYGRANAAASPFVISIENAGISVLPSVMNAVILIAVLSVGNSSVYGSSRTLAALADQGQAPKILGYIDRKGRPLVALIIAFAFGFIAYASDSAESGNILAWMIGVSSLSAIFTWASICFAHIRFRKAWKMQGHTLDELSFRSQPGVIGSWFGLAFNCLILVAQFWVGAWPVGYRNMTGAQQAQSFFLDYLAVPVVIIFFVGYKLWTGCSFMHIKDMDLHTGMREINLPQLVAQEKAERDAWPRWKKIYKVLC